ncbi:MAG: GNAT family N-acetyltransferase [Proteobacteria bacterium]|nr:GNAT family N-acetyltransferase [Pseudomonadota bacterium]
MSAPTLRPYLPNDLEDVSDVFRLAVEVLTEDDYSEGQRTAWMSRAEDEAFADRLAKALTLVVAGEEEGVVGFGSLKDNTHIDFLFTRPDFIRQGVATLIMDALEKLAGARGATKLTADVSDTAQPFFAARGFTPVRRNTVAIDGEWLGNTTMEKPLTGAAAPQGRA